MFCMYYRLHPPLTCVARRARRRRRKKTVFYDPSILITRVQQTSPNVPERRVFTAEEDDGDMRTHTSSHRKHHREKRLLVRLIHIFSSLPHGTSRAAVLYRRIHNSSLREFLSLTVRPNLTPNISNHSRIAALVTAPR